MTDAEEWWDGMSPNQKNEVWIQNCAAPRPQLEELCQKMLQLRAFVPATGNMKASEIKELLLPFFGHELIEKSVAAICGNPSILDPDS